MVSNGSLHYDHDSDGTHTSLSGCQANIRALSTDSYLAIRYENNTLMVQHLLVVILMSVYYRVTTFLENREMPGNFAVVREMSRNWPFVRENCYNVCVV